MPVESLNLCKLRSHHSDFLPLPAVHPQKRTSAVHMIALRYTTAESLRHWDIGTLRQSRQHTGPPPLAKSEQLLISIFTSCYLFLPLTFRFEGSSVLPIRVPLPVRIVWDVHNVPRPTGQHIADHICLPLQLETPQSPLDRAMPKIPACPDNKLSLTLAAAQEVCRALKLSQHMTYMLTSYELRWVDGRSWRKSHSGSVQYT